MDFEIEAVTETGPTVYLTGFVGEHWAAGMGNDKDFEVDCYIDHAEGPIENLVGGYWNWVAGFDTNMRETDNFGYFLDHNFGYFGYFYHGNVPFPEKIPFLVYGVSLQCLGKYNWLIVRGLY